MTREEQLIKVYQEAQQRLIQIIAAKEAAGSVTRYQEEILRQVNQVLAQLKSYSATWAQQAMSAAYALGAAEAVKGLGELGVKASGFEAFAGLHKASVDILVSNTQSMLIGGVSFVGRQIEDVVRQAGLDAIAQKQATGATVRQAAKLVKERLAKEGINGIRDKRGRMISLDAYASTVARSTTREATNTATTNQLQYEGYDLVKMSTHATTCPVCGVLQGRVYSISGRSTEFPPLSKAFRNGYANVHPNCRHVVFPYIPALATDLAGDKTFSNRSFDIDPRSQAAIDRYKAREKEQRQLRTDRNQLKQYQMVLGDDAPKTLAGYRRMKAANSERYNNLKDDFKDAMKPEEPEVAPPERLDTSSAKFAEMRTEEDKLRPLKKEVGIIYDTNGQEVWRQQGELSTVDISDAHNKGALNGNILTHNHPRGTSFSDTDIYVMAQNNMAAIRAVTKNHTYEARMSEEFKKIDPFERARMLKDKVKEYEPEVKKELSTITNGKEIPLHVATLEQWHRIWERIAKNEGWIEYSRKIHKDAMKQ